MFSFHQSHGNSADGENQIQLAAVKAKNTDTHLEANEELEKITPALRAHADVLEVRYEIYSKAGKWDLAAEIAHTLNQIRPLEPQFWIWRAYATRRMPGGGIATAKEILLKAQALFPKEPNVSNSTPPNTCGRFLIRSNVR
jgi:hypothetical protein